MIGAGRLTADANGKTARVFSHTRKMNCQPKPPNSQPKILRKLQPSLTPRGAPTGGSRIGPARPQVYLPFQSDLAVPTRLAGCWYMRVRYHTSLTGTGRKSSYERACDVAVHRFVVIAVH